MDRVIREFDLELVGGVGSQAAQPSAGQVIENNTEDARRRNADVMEERVRANTDVTSEPSTGARHAGQEGERDVIAGKNGLSGCDYVATSGAFLVACLLRGLDPTKEQGEHPQDLYAVITGTEWEIGCDQLAQTPLPRRPRAFQAWLTTVRDPTECERAINHQAINIHGPSQGDQDDPLTLSAKEPLNSAEKFVVRRRPKLMHCNDDWLDFGGAAYVELEDATIRSELYDFLKGARQAGTPPKAFNPTKSNVTNIVDALEAVTHRAQARFAPPCWLEGTGPEPLQTIVCQNGLLHLPTGKLHHATPRFYTRNALPFEFDPAAPEPERWLQFLDEVWPGKNDEIGTLQEIFGYLLVPDTSLQKIFMLVGPARSGKGTIARVLTHLVGKPNTSAPTLSSLSGDFGLQPLIGKQLGLISDMRLGQKTDHAAVAENLLRISGEDTVDVHRKYKSAWTGLLAVRFFIMTNVLPRFVDASGALASRFVPLIMRESFVGRENPRLLDELLPERPSILNWGIKGWRRLQKRGHFVLPAASDQAIQQLRDLASPQAAFIRDRCQLDPDAITPKKWIFDAWKAWCEEQGCHHGAMETFSAGLLAASNGMVETCKPRSDDKRVPSYRGIRLIDETPLGGAPPF